MSIAVECPECGRTCGIVADPANIWVALRRHRCHPTTRPLPHPQPTDEGKTAMPLKVQPDPDKRPHPRDLVDHPDKRIARAAARVMDALTKLDEAWEANTAKAALRAKRDKLKKQLAAVEAELKGAPPVNYKAVREWAEASGYQVSPTGKPANFILEAYTAAHDGGAA